jgi:type I pullulanase
LKGKSGEPVGIKAIKDLGITHLQLLPIYDFASVDELKPTFNWGYDPLNYNVPEGSYSSDPKNPKARIKELKQAIQSLHSQGIRVVMDVVYNHVYDASSFSQSKIVPGYWFRTDNDGKLTSASGCGNDSASERSMVRKFIVDSVKYWASEYNLGGFRFDLMGLHDIETMRQVRAALDEIDPTIIIIGEGWNMGTHPSEIRSNQRNITQLPGVAVFNDQIRDGIKGSVFNSADKGFATGISAKRVNVMAGIVGNIDFSSVTTPAFSTLSPAQSVNYVEAHDNNTLQDKLRLSLDTKSEPLISQYHRLASSIPLLAQGIPFIHAGQEFQRSKGGDSNSYQSGDEINSLKWGLVTKNATTRKYFKGLLSLRAQHPAFRIEKASDVKAHLRFLKTSNEVIAYSINGSALGDSWKTIIVVHNAATKTSSIKLPKLANWNVVVEGKQAGVKTLRTISAASQIQVPALSTMVIYTA